MNRFALMVFAASVVSCTRPTNPAQQDASVPSASVSAGPSASQSAAPTIPSARAWDGGAPSTRTVRILYTADEHGWLQPHQGGKGGAVTLLHQWVTTEHLCLPDPSHTCEDADTVALSGGDNWTGPVLSSYYKGRTMAEAMGLMGYAAGALGNHEFDNGQQVLAENAKVQGFDFVSANVVWTDGHALPVVPIKMVHRNSVRIALIGLTTTATPIHLTPSHVEGVRFEDEEQTLNRVVPQAWATGADVVAVIAHVCPDVMNFIVGRHPEWNLSFVGAGHCHQNLTYHATRTPVFEPDHYLLRYGRIILEVDLAKPVGQRQTGLHVQTIELGVEPVKQKLKGRVAELAARRAAWEEETQAKLGEVIGHTQLGMKMESPAMVRWILGAWRQQTGAQVAILNLSAMRQNLRMGPIRVRDLYDILPFDLRLVKVRLPGKDLIDEAGCCKGLLDGITKGPKGWALVRGEPIDPEGTYEVVTTSHTFEGGNGFHFSSLAVASEVLGDWREPLIAWMKTHRSTAARPLESMVFGN